MSFEEAHGTPLSVAGRGKQSFSVQSGVKLPIDVLQLSEQRPHDLSVVGGRQQRWTLNLDNLHSRQQTATLSARGHWKNSLDFRPKSSIHDSSLQQTPPRRRRGTVSATTSARHSSTLTPVPDPQSRAGLNHQKSVLVNCGASYLLSTQFWITITDSHHTTPSSQRPFLIIASSVVQHPAFSAPDFRILATGAGQPQRVPQPINSGTHPS